jgi:hypothetical protein
MNDKYIVLVKEDYDRKSIYCYSLKSGEIMWATDPEEEDSPQAIYSMILEKDTLYGIGIHPGQGFNFVSYDCKDGTQKSKKLIEGFGSIPLVNFRDAIYGNHVVAELQDRKDFYLIIIDKNTGEVIKKIMDKGDGPIGEVGRISMTVQDGHPVLFSRIQFKY